MRRTLFLAVAVPMMLAAATLTGLTVDTVPAAATGSTPGTYTNYRFADSALTDVTFGTTVRSDPGRGNVFWSHQFGFTTGPSGYIGMQRWRTGTGMFLFSVWDATAAQAGSAGTYCQTFSEGGTGYTCRDNAHFAAGHHYRYHVAPAGSGWYRASITDTTAGTSFVLGSVQIGAGGRVSTGGMVDWVEYFDWNNSAATCADEPYSAALFDLPTGTDASTGARSTASVSGTSVSSTCADRSSVTVQSGGSVQRDAIGNSASGPITGIGGQCVDITGGGSADGTALELWACTGNDNQNWVLAADGTIHALFKCMDIQGGGTADGTPVELYTCNGGANQQWRRDGSELVNPASGRCLDATGGSSASGTRLELWDCHGGSNQSWTTPA